MNNLPPSRPSLGLFARRAFTLIELLVVISIIAVLAGLLLPVVQGVSNNAKKVETKAAAMQIVAAIKNYQTEYGQYPAVPATTGQADTEDKRYVSETNKALFSILRATNYTDNTDLGKLNARRIPFFEGKDAKNPKAPRSGFVPSGTSDAKGNPNNPKTIAAGDFVDSWGNLFNITMDTTYNDVVPNPYPADSNTSDVATDTTGKILRFGVIVWSYGNDGKIGDKGTAGTASAIKYGDDVVSWQ